MRRATRRAVGAVAGALMVCSLAACGSRVVEGQAVPVEESGTTPGATGSERTSEAGGEGHEDDFAETPITEPRLVDACALVDTSVLEPVLDGDSLSMGTSAHAIAQCLFGDWDVTGALRIDAEKVLVPSPASRVLRDLDAITWDTVVDDTCETTLAWLSGGPAIIVEMWHEAEDGSVGGGAELCVAASEVAVAAAYRLVDGTDHYVVPPPGSLLSLDPCEVIGGLEVAVLHDTLAEAPLRARGTGDVVCEAVSYLPGGAVLVTEVGFVWVPLPDGGELISVAGRDVYIAPAPDQGVSMCAAFLVGRQVDYAAEAADNLHEMLSVVFSVPLEPGEDDVTGSAKACDQLVPVLEPLVAGLS